MGVRLSLAKSESNMTRGKYLRTEEHRKRARDVQIGTKHPHSEETKRKISEANKISQIGNKNPLGCKRSKEYIDNMIKRQKGKKLSLETRRKMSESSKGARSNTWKGGVTSINTRIRKSGEYKYWRKQCLKRDNFTCQKTGQRGGELRIHHINNFADFPELRMDINNGITLSKDSHEEFHRIYTNYNNTEEQLEEFLNSK